MAGEIPVLSKKGLMVMRRRKKWKFAHFNAYPNCFQLDKESPKDLLKQVKKYLPKNQPFALELAAGNAQFSLELARCHPQQNYIAIDIKSDRLYTSAKKALEEEIANIAFIRMPIALIGEVFGKNSVDEIWLTFPDPFPRKRSAKHRLTHLSFLQQYRNILKNTAKLKFKTDNRGLFLWSLEQLVADKWQFLELTFDLHESDLADDYKIKTAYETRFMAQGLPINFVSVN
jgi:tRNA (guanine-N7-)-methyltransferase